MSCFSRLFYCFKSRLAPEIKGLVFILELNIVIIKQAKYSHYEEVNRVFKISTLIFKALVLINRILLNSSLFRSHNKAVDIIYSKKQFQIDRWEQK